MTKLMGHFADGFYFGLLRIASVLIWLGSFGLVCATVKVTDCDGNVVEVGVK